MKLKFNIELRLHSCLKVMKWYQMKKFFSGFFLVCSLFGCKKCISGSENMKMSCNLSSALCKALTGLWHGFRECKTGAKKIGSIIARDVRHLHPGSARYRAKMAHIPGAVVFYLFLQTVGGQICCFEKMHYLCSRYAPACLGEGLIVQQDRTSLS